MKDEVTCRFCGNKLGLLQRLSNTEFCSSAHRDAYLREQEELALACLHEAMAMPEAARRDAPAAPVGDLEDAIPDPPFPEPVAGPLPALTERTAPPLPPPYTPPPPYAPPPRQREQPPPEAGFLNQGCALGPYYPVLDAECAAEIEPEPAPSGMPSVPPVKRVERALPEPSYLYVPAPAEGPCAAATIPCEPVPDGDGAAEKAWEPASGLPSLPAWRPVERPLPEPSYLYVPVPHDGPCAAAAVPCHPLDCSVAKAWEPASGLPSLPAWKPVERPLPEPSYLYVPVPHDGPCTAAVVPPAATETACAVARPRYAGATCFDGEAALASASAGEECGDPPEAGLAPWIPRIGMARPNDGVLSFDGPMGAGAGIAGLGWLDRRPMASRSGAAPAPRRVVKSVLRLQDTVAEPRLDPIPCDFGSQEDAWQPEF